MSTFEYDARLPSTCLGWICSSGGSVVHRFREVGGGGCEPAYAPGTGGVRYPYAQRGSESPLPRTAPAPRATHPRPRKALSVARFTLPPPLCSPKHRSPSFFPRGGASGPRVNFCPSGQEPKPVSLRQLHTRLNPFCRAARFNPDSRLPSDQSSSTSARRSDSSTGL